MWVCLDIDQADPPVCEEWAEMGPFFLPPLSASDGAEIAVALLVIFAVGMGVRLLLTTMGVQR